MSANSLPHGGVGVGSVLRRLLLRGSKCYDMKMPCLF